MNTNTAPEREEIEMLLPWHAAGTLSRRDAQRVEAALEEDPELRRQFDLVREEFSETIHLNETLGAPSARAMEKLFAGIEAESGPARQVSQGFSFSEWLSDKLSILTPRKLAYAGSAAAVVVALASGLITGAVMNQYGGGQAARPELSSGPSTSAPGGTGSLLMTFSPTASITEINEFLDKHDLQVTDGPRAGRMYRVVVKPGTKGPLSKEQNAKLLDDLRQGSVVLNVLPDVQ
ncbi:hypothetical protein GJW-30_1_03884 [Variibacter gotjawalensis]|uniref:Uncharacterized protein n=1 Tax=Variibacter gotjawalensis TaxID=1333996 RepID=A0A0S3PZF8_9BRAD|nr:zf-HC2 domain-containing protein [Variibacter gotjawalensis]NIK47165.1 hypothetical protein [Variibacter gotjawalensis]RZS49065.1 hypothetical protein EV661_1490 [Variibacter gotjawalensis]BAT61327.1 hypothetical protein GJW-30_1_03884 [Variibacter gotjawalensis]